MALTSQYFLEKVDRIFSDDDSATVARQWVHPFLRLTIRSTSFDGVDPDDREQVFAHALSIDVPELRALSVRAFIRWDLLGRQEDYTPMTQLGTGWLELLDPGFQSPNHSSTNHDHCARYIHFYGYKGGQGRTTALSFLAKALAEDGWRVLAVDFDAEAPSLDIILGGRSTSPESSVLGFRMSEKVPTPVGLGITARGGEVSVLPFRPESEAYDFDAAALAFELQTYAAAATQLSEKLGTLATDLNFDVVLIDHRTGLGPIVPVLARDLPGPVVVCSRLDGQSKYARRAVEGLWRSTGEMPGILLSLAPPEESIEEFRQRRRGEAEEFLAALARSRSNQRERDTTDDDGDPQDYIDHWVVWPFELELARAQDLSEMRTPSAHRVSIDAMRRIVDLKGRKTPASVQKSGAIDEGDLIVTQALRRLMTRNSPYALVVGRKGTGKTRIVRALVEQKLGEPLLVPSDFPTALGGIRAQNIKLKKLIAKFRNDPELFWYILLISGMRVANDTSSTDLIGGAEDLLNELDDVPGQVQVLDKLLECASSTANRRVFLVDALESAFEKKTTFPFVRGLFSVLESIDATPELSSAVGLRLFVRRDLVEHGIQNREQIEAGRRIDLHWDTRTIFNFVLSRIKERAWFRERFPTVVQQINERSTEIHEGQVTEEECEQLLFQIFPRKLSYKNMLTATFFRTYFSDDGGGGTSYYPRVYMVFLEEVEKLSGKTRKQSPGQKIDGTVVVKAHEKASQAFLEEVSQELAHAADVDPLSLRKMLNALDGERTPFDVDALAKRVARSVKDKKQDEIREIFDTMRQLGVFEDYPKRPNQWRPGRLFKTALKMRFQSRKR